MHPILLDLPRVTTYGFLMLLALVTAWAWSRHRAKILGITPAHIDIMGPLLVAAGFIGAWAAGEVLGEGRMLWGYLLASVAAGLAYCLHARLPLGQIGDVFAPTAALSIAIVRVGCFFAGCCWGKTCDAAPWAVRFPVGSLPFNQHVTQGWLPATAPHSLPVHPVQLYEALGTALLALALARKSNRPRVPGEVFLALGMGYAIVRFFLEFVRADNIPVGGLTNSQWLCLGVFITCLALGWSRRLLYASPATVTPQNIQPANHANDANEVARATTKRPAEWSTPDRSS